MQKTTTTKKHNISMPCIITKVKNIIILKITVNKTEDGKFLQSHFLTMSWSK